MSITFIRSLLLFGICVPFSQAYAFSVTISGDGGEVGERAQSVDCQMEGEQAFTSDATNTKYTDERYYSGKRALKLTIDEGSKGFGSFGGIIKFENCSHVDGKKLVKGDEIWVRMRLLFPEDFEFSQETRRQKFLRFRVYDDQGDKKVSEGYNDLYIVSDPDSREKPFQFIFEGEAQWADVGVKEDFFKPGKWTTIEYYMKLGNVKASEGGEAKIKVWVDGRLVADIDNRRTINSSESYIESFNFFTYWSNYGAHKQQSFYADDFVITSATPPNKDKTGFPFIGVGDYHPEKASPRPPGSSK